MVEEEEEMEEKSVRESPNGIIYQATPHLSQSARVARAAICMRDFWILPSLHVLLFARA